MEAQNFVQKHRAEETERRTRWKVLISTDARRVVRVLTAARCSPETIDGDTWWDIPSILNCLQDPSKSPQSAVWRRLVRAGLITALCKCSIKMQMWTLMPDDAPPPTEEEKKARIKELPSPWYEPLAIICTAAVGCAMPPTDTEKQIFEEIKQDWAAIAQRIYSEPINSLDQEPYSVLERAILAQIVLRMSSLDPTFFDVIFKPTDMTLAVCFRGWVYATAREDTVLNNSLILSIFGSSTFVSPWRDYFATHPAPSDSELMRRLIQGASMGVADHKKLTPPQAAQAIVTAFAKHLTMSGLTFSEVLQEVEFLKTFWAVARKEFPAFSPAVCRSEALWAALPRVVRRAVDEPRAAGRGVVADVLIMYEKMIQTVVNEGPEAHADALVHCWVAGGLFDMLEEHLVRIMNLPDGCMALTLMLNTIDMSIPHLTAETRAELCAQLPRTGMVWKILKAGIASGENEDVAQYKRNIAGFFLAKGMPDPRNPVWRQGAWEMLAALGHKMRSSEDCARRGCDKAAGGLWCSAGACTGTRYCSRTCMKGDAEHREMCSKGWFAVAEESSRSAMAAEPTDLEEPSGMPDIASLQIEDID